MDNSEMRDHYIVERELGRKADIANRTFIQAFIDRKKEVLFENFCNAKAEDTATLVHAKQLVQILNDMENEIQTIITTGELAGKSLSNLEDEPTEGQIDEYF